MQQRTNVERDLDQNEQERRTLDLEIRANEKLLLGAIARAADNKEATCG